MADLNRIEIRLDDPNPLFKKWITSWLNEAVEKNSKARYNLREALESLNRFPLPLATGRECAVLRGFGPKLCAFLDEKLAEYKKHNIEKYEKSINFAEDVKNAAKKYKQKKIFETHAANKIDVPTSCMRNEEVIMKAGKFEIILLVDTHETTGKSKKALDETRQFLETSNIKYEIRSLNIGDFCWISRNEDNHELVLPYVVERKRMDDLASSIRDGRFHEQKYRLRDSGIKNLIYVIENHGNNQHVGLPLPTLLQAATNTHIHSGFQIKFTDSHRDTMLYLTVLTEIFNDAYEDKTLISKSKAEIVSNDSTSISCELMLFKEFNEQSAKTKDPLVKEIFIRQLVQLKSLSLDKALAITREYPTPRSLIMAYETCTSTEEKTRLLANIPCGKLKRPIGFFISKTIYEFYMQK